MPINLPQIPESMFSTYDPHYIPGYTGFIPKLQSDTGKIYGNATLTIANHEPGLQKSSKLAQTGWGDKHGPSLSVLFDRRIPNGPTNRPGGSSESWNIKNGQKHIMPREENIIIKSMTIQCTMLLYLVFNPLTTREVASPSCLSSYGDEKKRFLKKDCKERDHLTDSYKTNDYLQRRQGKLIYRTDTGLLPNYGGYIPGQMFVIGKTWGKSSVDAIGKLQEQPFLWTSLF
ncbi:ciliary microtubule inner protein 2B-like [Rhinophrynus dorsalis]